MSIKRPWMVALLVVACCYGSLALAELTPVDPKTRQDIVFQILAQIASRVTTWEAQVTSAASYLFWTLGTISLSWTMGMMILKRADIGEFFAEFIRFIFFFGLFYALLQQGPNLARLILESMLQLGQEAAGSTIKYQTFIDIGTELMSRAEQFQQTGASKEDSFLVVGLCAGILLMLTTMVINLFLVFVAGWFLMYAGIFFLGFGGSRWTSDIAIGYYKAVIAVGIQMFVMALIMGIATDVLGDFFDKFSFEMRFYELLSFLVATFAFMTIFNRIPQLLSGLISGASIGISQGELGGALRGANGADPFGAGRMALGTAAGGAQKLFAAMSAATNQSSQGAIPSIGKTAPEPPSLRLATAGMLPGMGALNASGAMLADTNMQAGPAAPTEVGRETLLPTEGGPVASDQKTKNDPAGAEQQTLTAAKEEPSQANARAQGAEAPSNSPRASPEVVDASAQSQGSIAGASTAASTATVTAAPQANAPSPAGVETASPASSDRQELPNGRGNKAAESFASTVVEDEPGPLSS